MRLYDEIFLRADGAALCRCVVVPNGGGYFEGVKSVGDFSPEKIHLFLFRGGVDVEGENLTIKKYCDSDLELGGKIALVRFTGGKESAGKESAGKENDSKDGQNLEGAQR